MDEFEFADAIDSMDPVDWKHEYFNLLDALESMIPFLIVNPNSASEKDVCNLQLVLDRAPDLKTYRTKGESHGS